MEGHGCLVEVLVGARAHVAGSPLVDVVLHTVYLTARLAPRWSVIPVEAVEASLAYVPQAFCVLFVIDVYM